MIAQAWFLETPKSPLAKRPLDLGEPNDDEALVEVRACGLCHTDLGYADGSVAPKHPLPLVLGHEIVGVVRAGARALLNQPVLVPSVIPCGTCAFCRSGRSNACPRQAMPGNDVHGGFATHVRVPARGLVSLADAPATLALDSLSVVADAASTAYQAVKRSGLAEGDVAFVIGSGGVGGFVAQMARALGAAVAVCDVDGARLAPLAALGLPVTVNVAGRDPKDVRKQLHGWAKELTVPSFRWRIFECSGHSAGQTLAWTLISTGATLVVVGYTREPVSLRLSNLMAFDATVHGSWGCPIEAFPAVLRLIYAGKIAIEPFIERAPMSKLDEVLGALARHQLQRRMVLDPNA
jgi:6-hydroxycyclohex-1-ene-1-carbonyl-CoA dehydrogenase